MLREQGHPADTAVLGLLAPGDPGLADDRGAVFKLRPELHIAGSDGQHPAGDGQNLAHPAHRRVEGRGNAVEGRQEKVPEALPGQGPLREAVVHQLAHQGLGIGQGLHAVADVPRRRHAKILPQAAGAAAVVRHRHDGGEVFRVVLQAPQHGGKTVATANGSNAGAVCPGHPVADPAQIHLILQKAASPFSSGSCPGDSH